MNAYNKFIVVMVALFISTCINAQDDKKINFQIRGGMNVSNMSESDDHYWATGDAKIGYNIGTAVYFPIGKGMYVHTGLGLTSKGAEFDSFDYDFDNVDIFRTKLKMNAVYLQMPLYFGYKLDFSKFGKGWDNKLGVSAGPYVGYGIFGKTKLDSRHGSIDDELDTFDLLNRLEIGLGVEATFELKQLVFFMGTDVSLTNVMKSKYRYDDEHISHNNFYFGIGYSF